MGTYGVQVHDLQIRPPLMGGEWGRAIGTVPRTPQAPDRPLLGGAARDYVETVVGLIQSVGKLAGSLPMLYVVSPVFCL
jgi:hypothetical protein